MALSRHGMMAKAYNDSFNQWYNENREAIDKYNEAQSKLIPEDNTFQRLGTNLLGTAENWAGGTLASIGAMMNGSQASDIAAQNEMNEALGLPAVDMPKGTGTLGNIGQWLIDDSKERMMSTYSPEQEKFKGKGIGDILQDFANGDYSYLSANGIGMDTMSVLGSQLPQLAVSRFLPGSGAMKFAQAGALTEGLTNAGNNIEEWQKQGLNSQQIADKVRQQVALDAPGTFASDYLTGKLFSSKGFTGLSNSDSLAKRAFARMGLEPAIAGVAEKTNEELQNQNSDYLTKGEKRSVTDTGAWIYNNLGLGEGWTGPNDEDKESGRAAFASTLLLGSLGGGVRSIPKPQNLEPPPAFDPYKNEDNPYLASREIDTLGEYADYQNKQGVDNSAASLLNSIDVSAEPAYTISDGVSDTGLTALTDRKLRALDSMYFKKYGQHLYVTSMKRNGGGGSWHDSGQAIDVADDNLENNSEARRWIEERAKELGLTPLDEYEHPSAHATGGHMHFSDHGEMPDGSVADVAESAGDIDPNFNDVQNEAWGEANWVSEQTGIPAEIIYRQWAHESGNFTSRPAKENNNYGGLTQTEPNGEENKQPDGGNYYKQYNNMHEFAEDYVNGFIKKYDGMDNINSVEDFAQALKNNGYYGATVEDYVKGMKGFSVPNGKGKRGVNAGSVGNITPNMPKMDNPKFEDYYKMFAQMYEGAENNPTAADYLRMIEGSTGQTKLDPKEELENVTKAQQALQTNDEETINKVAKELGYGVPVQPQEAPQPAPKAEQPKPAQTEAKAEADNPAPQQTPITANIDINRIPFMSRDSFNDSMREIADKYNATYTGTNSQTGESFSFMNEQDKAGFLNEMSKLVSTHINAVDTKSGEPLSDSENDMLNEYVNNANDNQRADMLRMMQAQNYDGVRKTLNEYVDSTIANNRIKGNNIKANNIKGNNHINDNDNDITKARLIGQALMSNPLAMTNGRGTNLDRKAIANALNNGNIADVNKVNAIMMRNLMNNGGNVEQTIAAYNQGLENKARANVAQQEQAQAERQQEQSLNERADNLLDDNSLNDNSRETRKFTGTEEEVSPSKPAEDKPSKKEANISVYSNTLEEAKDKGQKLLNALISNNLINGLNVAELAKTVFNGKNKPKVEKANKYMSGKLKETGISVQAVLHGDNVSSPVQPNYSDSTPSKPTANVDSSGANLEENQTPNIREAMQGMENQQEQSVQNEDNKKTADESGEKTPKDKVVEKLRAIKNTPITNKATGIVASFGVTGINKMTSNAAISKSQKNGFSRAEHLEAVSDIVSLFENAELTNIHDDKNNAPNLLSIKRFTATIDKDKSALITVKESVVNGHRIYSLELEEIKKAPSERVGHEDMTYTDSALSADSSVPQNQREVKENQQEETLTTEVPKSEEFKKSLTDTEKEFMNYLDEVYPYGVTFNDVLAYAREQRQKAIDERVEEMYGEYNETAPGRREYIMEEEHEGGYQNVTGVGAIPTTRPQWYSDMYYYVKDGTNNRMGSPKPFSNGEVTDENGHFRKKWHDYIVQEATRQLRDGYTESVERPSFGYGDNPTRVSEQRAKEFRALEAAINGLEGIAAKAKEYEAERAGNGTSESERAVREGTEADREQALELGVGYGEELAKQAYGKELFKQIVERGIPSNKPKLKAVVNGNVNDPKFDKAVDFMERKLREANVNTNAIKAEVEKEVQSEQEVAEWKKQAESSQNNINKIVEQYKAGKLSADEAKKKIDGKATWFGNVSNTLANDELREQLLSDITQATEEAKAEIDRLSRKTKKAKRAERYIAANRAKEVEYSINQDTEANKAEKMVTRKRSAGKQDASFNANLAPNGKPSNLTPEQYKQVRTKEFKAWFGDWENDTDNASKVLDENGEPLVVYHGTATDNLTEFSHRKAQDKTGRMMALGLGKGKFYFIDNEFGAQSAANAAKDRRQGKNPQVMSVYLNVKNPITEDEYSRRFKEMTGKEIYSSYDTGYTMADRDKAIAKLDKQLQKEGYDGIIHESDRKYGYGQIAVFDPNQIKSATDNVGTFRTDSDNILQSRKAHTEHQAELDSLSTVPYKKLSLGQKLLYDFCDNMGVQLHFVKGGEMGDNRGLFISNGNIYLNTKSNVPARLIFWHEFTHFIKTTNPAVYKKFEKAISDSITPERIEKYRGEIYKGELMSDEDVIEEMIADGLISTAGRKAMMKAVIDSNPSKAKRILGNLWNMFCELKDSVLSAMGMSTTKNLPAGLNASELKALESEIKQAMGQLRDKNGKLIFGNGEQGQPMELATGEYVQSKYPLEGLNKDTNGMPMRKYSAGATSKSTDVESIVDWAGKRLSEYKQKWGFEGRENVKIGDMPKDENKVFYPRVFFQSPTDLAKKYPKMAYFVNAAKEATETQERLRGIFTEGMNEIEELLGYRTFSKDNLLARNEPNYEENRTKFSNLLWLGDIEQKEYSEEELRAVKDGDGKPIYNEQIIKAYKKAREMLNKSWELVNDTKQQIGTFSKIVGKAELDKLKESKKWKIVGTPVEQVNTGKTKTGNVFAIKTYQVNLHGPKLHEHREVLSRQEIEDLQKDDNVEVISESPYKKDNVLGKLKGEDYFVVNYVSQAAPLGKRTGYIPHIFHDFFIAEEVKDKDGKVVGYNMLKSARTLKEAVKIGNEFAKNADEFAKKNPKFTKPTISIVPKQFHFPDEHKQAVLMGDMDYFKALDNIAESMKLTVKEAEQALDGSIRMRNKGRFLGSTLHRKGTAGFDDNVFLVLRHHFNQTSRYVALDKFKRNAISQFERTFGDITKNDLPSLARAIRNYIYDVNGNPSWVEEQINDVLNDLPVIKNWAQNTAGGRPAMAVVRAVNYPMTIAKLGVLNISSAFMNMTQLLNIPAALDSGNGDGIKRMKKAMQQYLKNDPTLNKFVDEELGLKYEIGIDVAAGYSKAEVVNRYLGNSMYLFKRADRACRFVTLIAAYDKAKEEGKTKGEAIAYAKEINRQVNFDYSVADSPDMFRRWGPIGQLLFQFQKFPVKQIELFNHIIQRGYKKGGAKKAGIDFAKYTLPYFLLSGVYGVPLMGLIGGAINALGASISGDDDWDWEEESKKAAFATLGKDNPIVRTLFYGALSNVPLIGADVAQRVGVGDFASGSHLPKTRGEYIAYGFGTFGSTIQQAYVQFAENHNFAEGLKAISPSVGNLAVAIRGESHTTRGRIRYKYDNWYERLLRAVGFTPINEKLETDLSRMQYSDKRQERKTKDNAIDDFFSAVKDGRQSEIDEATKKLKEAGVTPKSLQIEAEKRKKTASERKADEDKKKAERGEKKKKEFSSNDYMSAIK